MAEAYKAHPEPFQQKNIAEMYNFHLGSISRCLKRLSIDGFVRMERLSPHSNNKGIYLTKDGLKFVKYVFNKELHDDKKSNK